MTSEKRRVGRYLIYGLVDPRDRCLRYVGKTHKRRELRREEHVAHALAGRPGPIYDWIRSLQTEGLVPEIFVLDRVEASSDWRSAEQQAISRWRNWPASNLPYVHPPQTKKSQAVVIATVAILNIRPGG